MTTIPTEFTRQGWQFEQQMREGNIAIFKKGKVNQKNPKEDFEIIVIRQHAQGVYKGRNFYPAVEIYPTDEHWGVYGFSADTLSKAVAKFNELKEKYMSETPTAVTDEEAVQAAKSSKKTDRGRPRISFEFPTGEFRVKELSERTGVSIPVIHFRMKEAGNKIRQVRTERKTGTKGRAAGVYVYEEKQTAPVQPETATV